MSTIRYTGKRSAFTFLASVSFAAVLAVSLDSAGKQFLGSANAVFQETEADFLPPLPPRVLSADDLAAAQRAWKFFEQNTQSTTGFVNSVAGFPSTTLWDQGSYIFALISAEKLGIISREEASERERRFLDSFLKMELFENRLPNKAYNTQSLDITDYENVVLEEGIGWSALDIARVLLGFRALEKHNPSLSPEIDRVINRWDLGAFANKGELWGATRENGKTILLQEGRLGYEQYGARAAALWGLDVAAAMSAARNLEWVNVEGVAIPRDQRRSSSFKAITPILSEPFLLQAFEIGLNREGEILAHKVYAAQQARFERSGIPTMVSEDHLDQHPSFVYSSVFSNGSAWAVVDESGNRHDKMRTLSTKAVFGWDAIYGTEYVKEMRSHIEDLPEEGDGWQAGIYEESGATNSVYALNTNAIVLEALHYKAFGPFLGMNR